MQITNKYCHEQREQSQKYENSTIFYINFPFKRLELQLYLIVCWFMPALYLLAKLYSRLLMAFTCMLYHLNVVPLYPSIEISSTFAKNRVEFSKIWWVFQKILQMMEDKSVQRNRIAMLGWHSTQLQQTCNLMYTFANSESPL